MPIGGGQLVRGDLEFTILDSNTKNKFVVDGRRNDCGRRRVASPTSPGDYL
jgi:hypothetical protein